MNRLFLIVLGLVVMALAAGYPCDLRAAEETEAPAGEEPMTEGEAAPTFSVGRLVISQAIDNREPVGIADEFSISTPRVYCFLEARDVSEDTEAVFVWYWEGNEVGRVNLALGQGPRWRTYSSKAIGEKGGEWKVEVRDTGDTVLETVSFRVRKKLAGPEEMAPEETEGDGDETGMEKMEEPEDGMDDTDEDEED